MSKRLSSTPLYEVMVRRSEGGARRDPGEPAAPGDPGVGLGAGRSVRVPVGYLLIGGAGALLLLLLAYMLGAARGKEAARAELEEFLVGGDLPVAADRAQDPLLEGTGADPVAAEARLVDSDGDTSTGGASSVARPPAPARGVATPAAWGTVDSDPRQEGLHYLVLAETRVEGALRLAEFCRAQGLEAYAVRRHNSRFARVMASPGFASRSMSDPNVQRMMQEILRIGLAWKTRYPGESDLSDAYLIP